jgi:D-sedoheptulose 7-phosphate isomerase
MNNNFTKSYLDETISILKKIDQKKIDEAVNIILVTKKKSGRIFFLGVGGSAGNASHAVNDFRKILNIECYTPTDNVSELTANTNDSGWDSVFVNFFKVSKLNKDDLIIIFSVGGGSLKHKVSTNLVYAIDYAKEIGTKIIGIVGKKDGYTNKKADVSILIPEVNKKHITPHTEEVQPIIWHLIVSHPDLNGNETKWESL